MAEDKSSTERAALSKAYGPEKEAWKAAPGNCFTAEELARMADDFKDLKITQIPKRIYAA
jgi:hypothetical protein